VTAAPARLRDWVVVVVAAAAVCLGYLDKPFHIDDILYLRVADQILRTPADPYAGIVIWDAKSGQPASLFLTDHNPPLWKYCQAGVIAAFAKPNERGESETILHLLQMAVVIGAGLGLFQLGRRLTPYPLWATLVILTAPFFLPGLNIMLEAPALCFSIWAIEFQFRAWNGARQIGWGFLAGVFVAAAILTKYTSGLLLPLLFLECLRRRQFAALWFLAPPLLALIGWAAWGFATQGRPHLGAHGLAFDVGEWHLKALNIVRIVGAMQPFGILLLFATAMRLRNLPRRRTMLLLGVFAFACLIAWLDLLQARRGSQLENADVTMLQRAHFLLFTWHGVISLFFAFSVVTGDRNDDERSLWLWMGLVLVFNVCCTPFNAVRHLLLFFVPFLWIVGRQLKRLDFASLRWPGFAVSAALGFSLASADHQFAESARRVAKSEVRALVVDRAAIGRSVWFSANWGFVHYAQRAGAYPWVANPQQFGMPSVQAGDYVVQPKIFSWIGLENALPPGFVLRVKEHWQPMAPVEPTPASIVGQLLRTIAPGVNYYSIRANALPWELLVTEVDPADRRTGAFFAVPTLGDFLVYEVVPDPPRGTTR
jgi:hypothetical protein